MKRILILLLAVFTIHSAKSQSLVVTGSNSVFGNPCLQLSSSLTVKNISSDTLKIFCEKVIIDTTAGTDNNFCWGSNCYGVDTYVSSDFNELLPGEGDAIDFAGYYDAYCDAASATVEYCFYPESNPSDRTCITIMYNGSSTEVTNKNDFTNHGFYPNPSKEYTSIRFAAADNTHLKIIDILGNVVKDIHLSSGGQESIYVGDLNKGIYFGNLFLDNKLLSIKKLIVK